VLSENICNIYEAGTGVKYEVKHTSPVTAQVRIFARESVDLQRMTPHLSKLLSNVPRPIKVPGCDQSSIRAFIAHEV
jgi:hypothetical protein